MKVFFYFIIFLLIIYIFKNIFIFYKFNDQKIVTNDHDFIVQNIKDYNNIKKQNGIINNNDVLEYGIFKLHPFSHPNDMDINIIKPTNGMTILDCGCGLIETAINILSKYKNINLHCLTNDYSKKSKIAKKIKKYNYESKIKMHYTNYKSIPERFDELKFDRILFIESLLYTTNIEKILLNSKNILNDNGKIYIRTLTCSNTKSEYINKNIKEIQNKLGCNFIYHENMIYFLQNSGFKNIKFSSVPFILNDNFFNPLFYIPLLRYKILNIGNMFSNLSLSETMYIADK